MRPATGSRRGAWWPPVVALAVIVVVVVLIIWISGGSSATIGYDASYPQCSAAYPSNPLFGIVGVNGGLANNANPCISRELQWARKSPGQKHPDQPGLSLYIDTGNPGGHQVADWPGGGATPAYGPCNGLLTNACSYLYGEQRAAHSYHLVAALDQVAAKTTPWWLDVELTSTWAGTYELNIAALRGFIAGLRNAGATGPIGIYSTGAQWQDITGLTAQTTPTVFNGQLPGWVAGTKATLKQARRNCNRAGFTGTAPTLAQYRIGPLDADLRCTATH
jgi:hypothetical protein